ncbi:hypothetical protein KIN20_013192 [Parelaphostrongylus tenuis]|uniref:Uncharacterized protein n=1 Tax=Parelaphostrongylus tenuis TaxID=148309 RepID=A0AAD5MBT6_PARTN|nr:hypothetical protein KIN20_013192 [Parelaphostrongylus tenuis]
MQRLHFPQYLDVYRVRLCGKLVCDDFTYHICRNKISESYDYLSVNNTMIAVHGAQNNLFEKIVSLKTSYLAQKGKQRSVSHKFVQFETQSRLCVDVF